MEKNRYYIIAATTILLIIAFIIYPSDKGIKNYRLDKTDYKETLSASGRVEAKNRINMTFQKSGTIEKIYAIEGQYYAKNDPLLLLERTEEENEVKSKRLLLRIAQNNLREVENQYKIKALNNEANNINYENIKLLYERNLKLLEAGGVSQKDIEDLNLKLKEAEVKKTLAELEYKNYGPGGSVRDKALIDVDSARLQLEKADIEKNKKIIFAPFKGQVLDIAKENYSNAQMGELAVVFAEGESFITTDIDERDYQKVKEGQTAFIQFLNTTEIKEGTVMDVSPVIDRTKGTIKVRIELKEEAVLKTDIGVNVEIIVNEYKEKIIVPSEFVFNEPTRIILKDNERAKVILLKEYQKTDSYYVLFDSELDNYLGKDLIGKDLEDGKKIK